MSSPSNESARAKRVAHRRRCLRVGWKGCQQQVARALGQRRICVPVVVVERSAQSSLISPANVAAFAGSMPPATIALNDCARPAAVVRPQCAEVDPGLKMLPDTTLERLPRMADFALWATACETALWPAGTFWSAYCGNRDEAVENVIEADPVAAAVRAVMEERTEWTGTATDLLGALAESAGERVAKSKTWPTSPRGLSGRLRRAATFLRKIGIEIDHVKEGRARTQGHSHQGQRKFQRPGLSRAATVRTVRIVRETHRKAMEPTHSRKTRGGTVGELADGKGDDFGTEAGSAVRANSLKSANTDGADAKDANPPSQTGPEKNEHQGWRTTP